MATVQGWAKKVWRAKPVLCGVASVGLGFEALGVPPNEVHFTLAAAGDKSLVVSFGSDAEIEQVVGALIDFQQRRGKGKYGSAQR